MAALLDRFFGWWLVPVGSIAVDDKLYFTANDDELWRSDGAATGTQRVHSPAPGATLSPLAAKRDLLIVTSHLSEAERCTLRQSDGTAAGTRPVTAADSAPEPNGFGRVHFDTAECSPMHLDLNLVVAVDDGVFLTTYDGAARALWKSDGTAAGTQRLVDRISGERLAALGNIVFFSAYDPSHGWELWRSDGTPGGTSLVKDIAPGPASSHPRGLTVAGGRLFFVADSDGVSGSELWTSDGTSAGTTRVRDIHVRLDSLIVLGGWVLFAATDDSGARLWRSDGTEAGTVPVAPVDVRDWLAVGGGKVLFRGYGPAGFGLWVSDGTSDGTVLLREDVGELGWPAARGVALSLTASDD